MKTLLQRWSLVLILFVSMVLSQTGATGEPWCPVTDDGSQKPGVSWRLLDIADCGRLTSNPGSYIPSTSAPLFRLPVVFHVIQDDEGTVTVSDETLVGQVRILNEHYNGIPGTDGANSFNSRIWFYLATEDASGDPTSGIERINKSTWHNMGLNSPADSAAADSLNWDPTKFLNIYVIGDFDWGWATFPWRDAGTAYDGVRVGYAHVGNPPSDPDSNTTGGIVVHEIGHMLGLYHTDRATYCDSALITPACYRNGDLICDTPYDNPVHFMTCESQVWCDSMVVLDPPYNHMSVHYPDACRDHFTEEQAGRMRCTLNAYHAALYDSIACSLSSDIGSYYALLACPQGDMHDYVVTADFADSGMRHSIAAQELTLWAGSAAGYVFWDTVQADSAATAENDYATTLTEWKISGCGIDSTVVLLDGMEVGRAYLSVHTPDFLPATPGTVDAADLAALAPVLNTRLGDATYNPCMDIDPTGASLDAIDASDLTVFAAHVGHHRPGYGSKPLIAQTNLSLASDTLTEGNVVVPVELEEVDELFAFVLVLRPNPSVLSFVSWHEDPLLDAETYCLPLQDALGPKLVLLALSDGARSFAHLRLGELEFRSSDGADIDANLRVEFAQGARRDGTTWAVASSNKVSQPVLSPTTNLEVAHPNPFNPTTTIRYTVAQDGHVLLEIYDIQGRLVRTLVKETQRSDRHQVVWDAKDNEGREVANGIYLVMLKSESTRETQKLALVK